MSECFRNDARRRVRVSSQGARRMEQVTVTGCLCCPDVLWAPIVAGAPARNYRYQGARHPLVRVICVFSSAPGGAGQDWHRAVLLTSFRR